MCNVTLLASLNIFSFLDYAKGKATIEQYIVKEHPEFVSLALDGWSIHHHGYMGAIASKCRNKLSTI